MTLADRLTFNFGIDADLFRGKPIAYDVEYDITVRDGVLIKRAKSVKKALTLELIFKSTTGCHTQDNIERSDNTSLKMFKVYGIIKNKIRQKIR